MELEIAQSSRDQAILEAYLDKGVRLKDIGARFGVSRQRIEQIARKAGLPLRQPEKGQRTGLTLEERQARARRRDLLEKLERARLRHLHLVRECKREDAVEWLMDYEMGWV